MKNRISLFLAACGLGVAVLAGTPAQAQANGAITRQLALAPVEGLDLGVSGTVLLAEGSPQKIEVEGQAAVIDELTTEVANGTWRVRFKNKGPRRYDRLTFRVTVPQLKRVVLSGSGNIKSLTPLTAPELDVVLSGSGSVELAVANTRTSVRLSGSGDVALSGTTTVQDVQLSGSGNYRAFELKSADATAGIAGSGSQELYASHSLRAEIRGSGDIRYRGRPATVNSTIKGSGHLAARE